MAMYSFSRIMFDAGQSDETNRVDCEFLRDNIADKTVIAVSLQVRYKPEATILHPEEALQSVGNGYTVID